MKYREWLKFGGAIAAVVLGAIAVMYMLLEWTPASMLRWVAAIGLVGTIAGLLVGLLIGATGGRMYVNGLNRGVTLKSPGGAGRGRANGQRVEPAVDRAALQRVMAPVRIEPEEARGVGQIDL